MHKKLNSNFFHFNCVWMPCHVHSYLALKFLCYMIFPADIFWRASAGLVFNIVIGDHLGLLFIHLFYNMSISHTGYGFLIDLFQEPYNYSCHYVLSSRHILHGYLWLHMSQSLACIYLLWSRCPCQLHFIQDHCHTHLSITFAYSITITTIESITTADDIKTLLMDGDTDSLKCLLIHCN